MPPRSRAGADASAHVGHAEWRADRGGGGMKKVVDHTGKTFTYDEDTCEFVVEYQLLDQIGSVDGVEKTTTSIILSNKLDRGQPV